MAFDLHSSKVLWIFVLWEYVIPIIVKDVVEDSRTKPKNFFGLHVVPKYQEIRNSFSNVISLLSSFVYSNAKALSGRLQERRPHAVSSKQDLTLHT